jgi:invasion protein IalB
MRRIRATVAVAASALIVMAVLAAPAQAASLVGKPCTKAGTTSGDGPGRTVICTKMTKGKHKGKLIWQLHRGPNPGPGPGPGPTPGCTTRPVFTKDFIDPDQVQVVVPIGQQTAFGGVLSVRSYVHSKPSLDGQKLPLYAPVDMTLIQAAYYKIGDDPAYKPEYSLFFDAGCGIQVQLYHVKGVVGAVAKVTPKEPVPSSAGQPVTATPVKAGEQIGWFEGEAGKSVAFDFRVEDLRHTNSFINQSRFTSSPGASGELRAVCPYDFYAGAQRERWLAKLGAPSSDPIPGTACGTISQGKAGTAQGMWFFSDAKVNELTYRGETWNEGMAAGQYQSQILLTVDPGGTIRIGGLNAVKPLGQMMIGKQGAGSETWKDPLAVTAGQDHCWSNPTQSVKVRLSGDGASLTAVVGPGPCSSLDLARGQTYVR